MYKETKLDNLSEDELKNNINKLYEDMRLLAVELLRLNIDQYDGKYSRKVVEQKLTDLANSHIDLDCEIHKCQKLLKQFESESAENNK